MAGRRWVKLMTCITRSKAVRDRTTLAQLAYLKSLAVAGERDQDGEIGDVGDLRYDLGVKASDDEIAAAAEELIEAGLWESRGAVFAVVDFEATQDDPTAGAQRKRAFDARQKEKRATGVGGWISKTKIDDEVAARVTGNALVTHSNVTSNVTEMLEVEEQQEQEEKETITHSAASASEFMPVVGGQPQTTDTPSPAVDVANRRNPRVPECPVDQIVALFNSILGSELGNAPRGNPSRKAHKKRLRNIADRWEDAFLSGRERVPTTVEEGLVWFEGFFGHMLQLDWYCGRNPRSKWKADFDWLFLPTNFEKILNQTSKRSLQ